MKRKILWAMTALLACTQTWAQDTLRVAEYSYAGPFDVKTPVMVDSVNVKSSHYDNDAMLDMQLGLEAVEQGAVRTDLALPRSDKGPALHLAGFNLTCTAYTTASIDICGVKNYRLFVDGAKKYGGDTVLEPGSHTIVIKYLSTPESTDTLNVCISTQQSGALTLATSDAKRLYTLTDVLRSWLYSNVAVSPSGKYMMVSKSATQTGGHVIRTTEVRETATGRLLGLHEGARGWMPRTDRYYCTRANPDNTLRLVAVDPATGAETLLANSIPSDPFRISPDETYLVMTHTEEGPKDKKEIYEVIEPDDRQPGWRDRQQLVLFDLRTGLKQPLTFGYHNVFVSDISRDGRYLLMMKSESRLTQRPTTLSSVYRVDRETFAVDTLVSGDGFIERVLFAPDGRQVLMKGSPEALGGIGKNVREGQTPSMVDNQLFIMDLADKQVRAMTRTFDPSINSCTWSQYDGLIYFTAEDKDCVHLFRMNPKTGKIQRIDVPEDIVKHFSLATQAPVLAYSGQGAMNSDRMYAVNTKTLKATLKEDLSATTLHNIELGDCRAWNWVNTEGDTICCRYYLPPHFDAAQRYPMVVNYYGGCSPTSRNFESRYPHHAYAAQGYVVLVINPRGATGFGQQFSAHHVNTAGEGVAEDIIGAVMAFCKENNWVNEKKIGCIGASYGGFMTQYLQTKTDLFAAAISHAGISDHTSYWGEGYWGYSYSEVSMANSYPWTDKHLYVDQSPLFNADKIHTPLLFLHGTADTNVPVGESIQMYTALKLLGRPTAMVLVDGQNHHITDYYKRVEWQNTIFAWFARWLKDDATWWNALYKEKAL